MFVGSFSVPSSCRMDSITHWKWLGAFWSPKGILSYLNLPICVIDVVIMLVL